MLKRVTPYTFQSWMRVGKATCRQLIMPFTIFQGIRTVFFPSTFDVLLLGFFILVAWLLNQKWL